MLRRAISLLALAAVSPCLFAQAPPVISVPRPPQDQTQTQQQPANPNTPQATQPQAGAPRLADTRGLMLGGVALEEMIKILANMMKINIILDPRVKGNVTVYTY